MQPEQNSSSRMHINTPCTRDSNAETICCSVCKISIKSLRFCLDCIVFLFRLHCIYLQLCTTYRISSAPTLNLTITAGTRTQRYSGVCRWSLILSDIFSFKSLPIWGSGRSSNISERVDNILISYNMIRCLSNRELPV